MSISASSKSDAYLELIDKRDKLSLMSVLFGQLQVQLVYVIEGHLMSVSTYDYQLFPDYH